MKDKINLITFIVSICIMPFTISLVYGMYKLTCISDYYFIWMVASAVTILFILVSEY